MDRRGSANGERNGANASQREPTTHPLKEHRLDVDVARAPDGQTLPVFKFREIPAAPQDNEPRDHSEANDVGLVYPHEGFGKAGLEAAQALVIESAHAVGEDELGVLVGALDVKQVVDGDELDPSESADRDEVSGRPGGRPDGEGGEGVAHREGEVEGLSA